MSENTNVVEVVEVAPIAQVVEVSKIMDSRAKTIKTQVDTAFAAQWSMIEGLKAKKGQKAADNMVAVLGVTEVPTSADYSAAYSEKYNVTVTAEDWEASVMSDSDKVAQVIAENADTLETFQKETAAAFKVLFEALKPGLAAFGLTEENVKVELEGKTVTLAPRGRVGSSGPKGEDQFSWTPNSQYLCKRGVRGGSTVEWYAIGSEGKYQTAVKDGGNWIKFGTEYASMNLAMKAITEKYLGKKGGIQESAHRPIQVWMDSEGKVYSHSMKDGNAVDTMIEGYDTKLFETLKAIATA